MTEKITIAVAGLGNRGKDAYIPALRALQSKVEIVAIADPDEEKRTAVAAQLGLNTGQCYCSAEEMFALPQLATAAIIATQDRQHVSQAIQAMRQGYHLLLEKPISPLLEECREVIETARETQRCVLVCHVLRYTQFYQRLKEVLQAGTIGDIVSIHAIENVGYWHHAHSFVRGNWHRAETHSPMILQKCCHDFDLYLWLSGKTCRTVSSFGGIFHFKEANAPAGVTEFCTGGCAVKKNCPYDAEKIYVTNPATGIDAGNDGWPCEVLAMHPAHESILAAIQNGPYGRCVYKCNNNVVDHQVVNLQMEDGSTMAFTMSGFTEQNSREAKLMGTKGEILANLHSQRICICPFGGQKQVIDLTAEMGSAAELSGHAGGDKRMVEDFVAMLRGELMDNSRLTTLEASMESHYVALAAEESRLQGGKPVPITSLR